MGIWRDVPGEAKRLLDELWLKRYELGEGLPTELQLLDLLKPRLIARLLDLRYREMPKILDPEHQHRRYAGFLDPDSRILAVAQEGFSYVVQKYTAFHEAAHWVLHRNLNRGFIFRELSNSGGERFHKKRDPIEREADTFAALVIMPEQQLLADFQSYFGTLRLTPRLIDDNMRYCLSQNLTKPLALSSLRNLSPLELAWQFAASWPWFGQGHPVSLCERYEVSRKAMAIRFLELRLIQGDRS